MMPEAFNLSQTQLIKNFNLFFQKNDMYYKMSVDGVCNGLCTLYIKSVIAGRKEEFLNLVRRWSEIEPTRQEVGLDMQRFAMKVMVSQAPDIFDKSLHQRHSFDILEEPRRAPAPSASGSAAASATSMPVDPIEIRKSISLVASRSTWIALIKEIDMMPEEVVMLYTYTHAMVLTKENNQYILYDPNSKKGTKAYNDVFDLVYDIQAGYYASSDLGLTMRFIAPSSAPRPSQDASMMRDQVMIFSRYDSANNHVCQSQKDSDRITTLRMACAHEDYFNTRMMLSLALLNGLPPGEIKKIAIEATQKNNPESLKALLPHLEKEDLIECFEDALRTGRPDTFSLLNNHIHTANPDHSISYLYYASNPIKALKCTVLGENPALLQQVIAGIKAVHGPDFDFNRMIRHEGLQDVIVRTIQSKNYQCLTQLLDCIDLTDNSISQAQRLKYLLAAIEQNDLNAIKILIENQVVTVEQNHPRLDPELMEKTDLRILHYLYINMIFEDFDETRLKERLGESPQEPLSWLVKLREKMATETQTRPIPPERLEGDETSRAANIARFQSMKQEYQQQSAHSADRPHPAPVARSSPDVQSEETADTTKNSCPRPD